MGVGAGGVLKDSFTVVFGACPAGANFAHACAEERDLVPSPLLSFTVIIIIFAAGKGPQGVLRRN